MHSPTSTINGGYTLRIGQHMGNEFLTVNYFECMLVLCVEGVEELSDWDNVSIEGVDTDIEGRNNQIFTVHLLYVHHCNYNAFQWASSQYLYNSNYIRIHINIRMFTGVVKLAQIDDYIAPSQSCIQPKIMKKDPKQ